MLHAVLAEALLTSLGQIAAILIGLFAFIFFLLLIAFHVLMSFLTSWLREKAEMLKLLRPVVESVNVAHEEAERGIAPDGNQSPVVRVVATLPGRLQSVDQKVERAANHVAGAVIEMRARAMQARAVAKAFFLPGLARREHLMAQGRLRRETASPGYHRLMQEAQEAATRAEQAEETTSEWHRDVATH